MTLSVLAVCAGNICRSPTAVAAIREAAARKGLEIEVDSAGTGAWNVGEPPTPQAVEAGRRAGLTVEGRARRVNRADMGRFDVIVAMDRANLRDLTALAPSLAAQAKIRLFRTYDPTAEDDEIPDPYGGDDAMYDRTVRLVMASADGLVDTLMSAGVEDPVTLE